MGDPAAKPMQENEEIPLWNRLREEVVIVTQGRGREVFTLSRDLCLRLYEIESSGEEILQLSVGGRVCTSTTVAAVNLYLRSIGYSHFPTPPCSTKVTRWAWDHFVQTIGFEYAANL